MDEILVFVSTILSCFSHLCKDSLPRSSRVAGKSSLFLNVSVLSMYLQYCLGMCTLALKGYPHETLFNLTQLLDPDLKAEVFCKMVSSLQNY
jgi:hypothetical protein